MIPAITPLPPATAHHSRRPPRRPHTVGRTHSCCSCHSSRRGGPDLPCPPQAGRRRPVGIPPASAPREEVEEVLEERVQRGRGRPWRGPTPPAPSGCLLLATRPSCAATTASMDARGQAWPRHGRTCMPAPARCGARSRPTCLHWKKAKGGEREREEVRWEEIRKKREINKMLSSAPDATSKFFNPSRSCVQTF